MNDAGLIVVVHERRSGFSLPAQRLAAIHDGQVESVSYGEVEGWIGDRKRIPAAWVFVGAPPSERAAELLRFIRKTSLYARVPALFWTVGEPFSEDLLRAIARMSLIDFAADEVEQVLRRRLKNLITLGSASSPSVERSRLSAPMWIEVIRRLANELNNTLMQINAAVDQIDDSSPGPELKEPLAMLREAVEGASTRIDDALLLTPAELNAQPVDISLLLQEILMLHSDGWPEGIEYHACMDEPLWQVSGDYVLLRRAMTNLLSNAVEAIGQSGRIDLSITNTRIDATDERTAVGVGKGDYVQIDLRDSGSGFSRDIKRYLFDPFFTTRRGGRWKGVGLTEVATIVDRHRGWVWVDSKLGIGSVFSLLLPRSVTRSKGESIRPSDSGLPPSTFLIVDDKSALSNLIAKRLGRLGHRVLQAFDAHEGVSMFDRHKREIDFVLLDVNLGEISGFEVHDTIIQIKPDARIVLCTGYAEPKELRRFAHREGTEYLLKPFRLTELLLLLQNAFIDIVSES